MSSPRASRGNQPLLLLLGAVVEHVVRAHAVHALAEGAHAAARELGVHDRLVTEVAATATVVGRERPSTGIPVSPALRQMSSLHVVLLAPARIVRHHLGFGELATVSRNISRSSSIQGDRGSAIVLLSADVVRHLTESPTDTHGTLAARGRSGAG